MPRPPAHHGNHRLLLGMAVAIVLVLSQLPAGWISWVGWFSNVADKARIPIEAPVGHALRWLAGRVSPDDADPAALAEAQAEAARFKTLYLQSAEREKELREKLDAFTHGRALQPGLGVLQLEAAVLGYSGDRNTKVLKVRAGRGQGVATGDAVAYLGVHLVGRVLPEVDSLFCRVQAVTDRAAGGSNLEGRGRITGIIIAGETQAHLPPDPAAERLVCSLAAVGDGTLSGDVAYAGSRGDRAPRAVTEGMIVRLADDRWPATAQMLVLGVVRSVEPKPNQRSVVVVRPLYDLDAIQSVMVRIPADRRLGDDAGGTP